MFSNYPKTILLLKNTSLEIYKEKSGEKTQLEFPSEIVANQEIKDLAKMEALISNFLQQSNLGPKRVIIVLSDETYFQKILPKTDKENEKNETRKFIEEVPFDAPNLATVIASGDKEINIYCMNKNFFYGVADILGKLGWKVAGVVPINVYGNISKENDLKPEDLDAILKNTKVLESSNFLQVKSGLNFSSVGRKKILFIVVTAIPLVLLIWVYAYGINKVLTRGIKQKEHAVSIDIKSVPEASSSARPDKDIKQATDSAKIDKDKLKVKILNGTGIVGQATKVKNIFTKLGYKEIEISNAIGSNSIDTTIVLSENVPDVLREEVKAELSKVFNKILVQEGDIEDIDILITTGVEKSGS